MRPLLPVLLVGCASTPCDDLPSGKELRDSKRLLPIFQEFLRCKEYGKAHKCLSPNVIPYEAFYAGMTAFEVVGRLIQGLQQHGIDEAAGTMRLCNPEFGISQDFRITKFRRLIWNFDFTEADLRFFQDQALAWFRRQTEAAGHRLYVYPPDWEYARLSPACGCGR